MNKVVDQYVQYLIKLTLEAVLPKFGDNKVCLK